MQTIQSFFLTFYQNTDTEDKIYKTYIHVYMYIKDVKFQCDTCIVCGTKSSKQVEKYTLN